MAVLLITHDMGVIAARADRVMVMYAGKIVEGAGTVELFDTCGTPIRRRCSNRSPASTRTVASASTRSRGCRPTCPGTFVGCRFAPRCRYVTHECRAEPLCRTGPSPLAVDLQPPAGASAAAAPGEHVFACFHPGHRQPGRTPVCSKRSGERERRWHARPAFAAGVPELRRRPSRQQATSVSPAGPARTPTCRAPAPAAARCRGR